VLRFPLTPKTYQTFAILFQLLLAISYYQFISFFQYEKIKII